ncbi:MerR family transcriptional regulator [Micrococcus sp.]|uniref:transcriptional regulator FtsR n=1 Tax=Micrococcus sp. TaxID=1271 RepID=UPI002A911CC8|nr:MerR family transcriptional regulator [Micrococcus sp.]MDY6055585.1 MerR family transcriptional regulator [Micrococcus sp.]
MRTPEPRPIVPAPGGGSRGIGEFVDELAAAFPGLTASKVRFLEDRGLLHPERTAAGYRRYSEADLDRARLILTLQRDQFLPLRVIREQLEALDRGELPEDVGAAGSAAPSEAARLREGMLAADRRWTRAELAREAGAGESLVGELEQYALIAPEADGAFPAAALPVVKAAAGLAAHGIEPRHLRPFRSAADRELALVEQAVAPLASRRDADTRRRAAEAARLIADECLRLHAALVRAGLDHADEEPRP